MLNVPIGQLILALYAWISTVVYIYLVCKIIHWRRTYKHFQSSYYLLFLLQAAADLHTFIAIEFILRPRRYNYFKLFTVYMHGFAKYSFFCLGNARTLVCSGHIIIAINQLTSIYYPFRQEQIWTYRKTMLSMLLLWIVLISTSLPYLIFSNNVFFSSRPGGVIMLSAGVMLEYSTCQKAVTNLITMIVCTFCYVGCYLKMRDFQNGSRVIDRSLFFCALFSTIPFCVEVVRSIVVVATFEVKNDLYEMSIEFWYYEAEVLATSSLWMQLLINGRIRSVLLDRGRSHPSSSTTALTVI